MTLHWPQITFVILSLLGTGIALAKNGEPKDGKYSFLTAILSDVLIFWLLWAGGFFSQP